MTCALVLRLFQFYSNIVSPRSFTKLRHVCGMKNTRRRRVRENWWFPFEMTGARQRAAVFRSVNLTRCFAADARCHSHRLFSSLRVVDGSSVCDWQEQTGNNGQTTGLPVGRLPRVPEELQGGRLLARVLRLQVQGVRGLRHVIHEDRREPGRGKWLANQTDPS